MVRNDEEGARWKPTHNIYPKLCASFSKWSGRKVRTRQEGAWRRPGGSLKGPQRRGACNFSPAPVPRAATLLAGVAELVHTTPGTQVVAGETPWSHN